MARLPAVPDAGAPPAAAALFAAIRSNLGMVPNLYRVTANAPAALDGLLKLGDALAAGGFDARTREAIALTVAGANRCDYCASAHTAIARSLRVDPAETTAHLHGRSADPRLQAILAFAEAVVAKKGRVSDADLAAARAAGLGDAEIVETVGHVVQNIFTNYLNHVAETEIDFPAVRAA
jgi:uncharacterized peroxidase-related enzyme